jgi:hypothetical protein
MCKLGALLALASISMLAASIPGLAGCVCKDTRASWCAKTCYVCFANHAVSAGYCSHWLEKRKHRGSKDARSLRGS